MKNFHFPKNLKIYTLLALLLTTWLMTGIAQDDEFAEYFPIMKYRPDFQFYFKSPLGMQDWPKNYSPAFYAEEMKYDDFVHGKHWSKHFGNLAFLLQLATVLAVLVFGIGRLWNYLKMKRRNEKI